MCSTSKLRAMPLVFVPTPLGNLRDVTLRALDALRDADLIVAEDTRVARKLLRAFDLHGREIWSYREANARRVTPAILERARTALVVVTSDAGMPGISDPGSELIAAARAAGTPVEVLPGPSAATAVALLSGFPLRRFTFEGFPPRTPATRRSHFAHALQSDATTIWYESPQRISAALRRPRGGSTGRAPLRRARIYETARTTPMGNAGERDGTASQSDPRRDCFRDRSLR